MSVISTFYNKEFAVERYVTVTGSQIDTRQNVSSNNDCVFRPITDRMKLFNEMNMGKEFELFCDNGIDVKANDVIIVDDIDYAIAGISLFEDLVGGYETHQEVRVYRKTQ